MRRIAPFVLAAVLAACGSTAQTGNGNGNAAGGDDGLVASGGTTATSLGGVAGDDMSGVGVGGTSARGGATTRPGARSATGGPTSAGPSGAAPGERVTDPIKLGFVNTSVGNAEALGVNAGTTYSSQQVYDALVKSINEDGGLAGREIQPVYADTDTASNNWEVDFAAACERFTRDDPVEAVLGYAFVFYDSFEKCLDNAGVAHLNGGYNLGDVETFAQYPLLVGTTNATADRRYVLQLQGAVDAGLLTPEHRIGLMGDDCPYDVRAHERSRLPYIEKAHLQVVAESTISCATGAGDVGAIAGQIQNAVLQFRSRDVDTVVIEGVPTIVFAQTAESQRWYPRYLLTSTTGGAAIEPNIPASQAENMHGFGWFPGVDVNTSNQPPRPAGATRCLELLSRQGLKMAQYNDFVGAFTSCEAIFLYEAALNATGGVSDGATIVSAITSLGDRYGGASTYGGKTYFGPDRRDAPAAYRQWGWVDDCSCFRYAGEPRPF